MPESIDSIEAAVSGVPNTWVAWVVETVSIIRKKEVKDEVFN